MKLIDDGEVDLCGGATAKGQVGEDLLGATDHGSVRVYRGVASDHADVV